MFEQRLGNGADTDFSVVYSREISFVLREREGRDIGIWSIISLSFLMCMQVVVSNANRLLARVLLVYWWAHNSTFVNELEHISLTAWIQKTTLLLNSLILSSVLGPREDR